MSEITDRILRLKERRNISYAELEKVTGISRSQLQRYATGVVEKIPLDNLERIASALNVPAAVLMGWAEDESGELQVDYSGVEKSPADPKIDEAMKKLAMLSPENRAQAEKYLDFLLATQDKN